MNQPAIWILAAAIVLGSGLAAAKPLTKTVTTTTTGEGAPASTEGSGPTKTVTTTTEGGVPTTVIHQDDGPAVGDPVHGKGGVTPRADQGPANTQKYCAEGSTDPDCVRAEKRQLSNTTWQEDCASGATKACPK